MTVTFDDLRLINSKVNLLPYTSDAKRYFTPEWWAEILDDQGGDCEDTAITKYRRLFALGMPKELMRFATLFAPPWSNREEKALRYHADLLVDFEGQTYVLDNHFALPMEFRLVLGKGYEYHKLQVAGTPQWEWAQGADRSFE